jgi:ABC-type antimicrobial peptide transport system permease subunit
LLAGVNPADVLTFAVATGVTVAMVLVGSLLPVRRALRVTPISAMRSE